MAVTSAYGSRPYKTRLTGRLILLRGLGGKPPGPRQFVRRDHGGRDILAIKRSGAVQGGTIESSGSLWTAAEASRGNGAVAIGQACRRHHSRIIVRIQPEYFNDVICQIDIACLQRADRGRDRATGFCHASAAREPTGSCASRQPDSRASAAAQTGRRQEGGRGKEKGSAARGQAGRAAAATATSQTAGAAAGRAAAPTGSPAPSAGRSAARSGRADPAAASASRTAGCTAAPAGCAATGGPGKAASSAIPSGRAGQANNSAAAASRSGKAAGES